MFEVEKILSAVTDLSTIVVGGANPRDPAVVQAEARVLGIGVQELPGRWRPQRTAHGLELCQLMLWCTEQALAEALEVGRCDRLR